MATQINISGPPLLEIDSLEVTVLVDNEIDWMSSPPSGCVPEIGRYLARKPAGLDETGTPILDFMDICCGAHGLSLLLTARHGTNTHTILFDAGPQPLTIAHNVQALGVDLSAVERVVLSHWHTDHSAGLVKAIELILQQRTASSAPLIADLHPSRPYGRAAGHSKDKLLFRLLPDPTLAEIEAAGAQIELSSEPRTVGEGCFLVSGEIPRRTAYETGLPMAYRLEEGSTEWKEEIHIMDERFVAVNVKGKGIVVFTACSHAGVINVARHAIELVGAKMHMIIGGFHLAGPTVEPRISHTVRDMTEINPDYVVAGHCTGWRAKFAIEQAMPGKYIPSSVGMTVKVEADK